MHPILALYVADYPEQILATCAKYGSCPKCECCKDDLGSAKKFPLRSLRKTLAIMREAHGCGEKQSPEHCSQNLLSSHVLEPFWSDLPLCNIHTSITPDVLHQLFQGTFKHLLAWCQQIPTLSAQDLDARISCLPPTFGLRKFPKGITVLSQVSGSERKDLAKILLPCILDHLPNEGILACRSLLDFIYLAQYPTHDEITLEYMEEALSTFQQNKHYSVDTGIQEHLNIPKFHSLCHYVDSIRTFGTTDNYNTEMFERLHIDFAKAGWRASNHRDEFPQMITWLSRREKMDALQKKITAVLNVNDDMISPGLKPTFPRVSSTSGQSSHPLGLKTGFFLSKMPNVSHQSVQVISRKHSALGMPDALKAYLDKIVFSTSKDSHGHRQGHRKSYHGNPVSHVDVFYQCRIVTPGSHDDDCLQFDVIKAKPKMANSMSRRCRMESTPLDHNGSNSRKATMSAQFNAVVVMVNDEAQSTGLIGARIGRIRVIFKLPTSVGGLPVNKQWPKEALALVEWYSPLGTTASKHSSMYHVRKLFTNSNSLPTDPSADCSGPLEVVPLRMIRQSCMLVPNFCKYTSTDVKSWTRDNVLDKCNYFYVNNWSSNYNYSTLW